MHDGRRVVLVRALAQTSQERRVGFVVGEAESRQERQIGVAQVPWSPRQDEGVESQQQRRITGRLGPREQGGADVTVLRPVQLEPVRRDSPHAEATSSNEYDDTVDNAIGIPSSETALATAISASG